MKEIPVAFSEYNANMNGVDRLNQGTKAMKLNRAAKRFDRKISVFLIECIIHNANILFRKFNVSIVYTKFDFIKMLISLYLEHEEQECKDELIEHFF